MNAKLLAAGSIAIALATGPAAAVSILTNFNAGVGTLDSIAYDPGSDTVFVHNSFAAIREYTSAGAFIDAFFAPGASSNDHGIDL